jgi:hypothetical protein
MLRRLKAAYISGIVLVIFTIAITIFVLRHSDPRNNSDDSGSAGITTSLVRQLPGEYPSVIFSNVSSEAGIVFHHFDAVRSTLLPEDMGSGAAWGDFDNDGDLDLYVVNFAGPLTWSEKEIASARGNALYRNNGDGTFSDIGPQSGVDHRGWGMGAWWGDYDGDDYLDLYVTCYGPNILYKNNGDNTFTDVTRKAGVGDDGFSAGAAWGDYDMDGDLDLYLCNYVDFRMSDDAEQNQKTSQYKISVPFTLNPSSYEPSANRLYRNNGNGTFTDVARELGVHNPTGRSLSATFCDFDHDGLPDIYVANDVSSNAMHQNVGDGKFIDIGASSWAADYRGAMGLAVGDFDNDEDMDIFLTHWISQENTLYSNMLMELKDVTPDTIRFRDVADGVGLGQIAIPLIGFGTDFFDYDNDGLLDILVVNGSTFENPDNTRLLIPMKSMLFWNKGKRGFYDLTRVAGDCLREKIVGRGAAFGDYDNDGDVDVFIVVLGGQPMLLRNDGGEKNHWLKVRTIGLSPNTRGVGARLKLIAGGSIQIREIGAGNSYISQNSLEAEFGLGENERVELLEVIWPGGDKQTLHDIPADQIIILNQGDRKSL